MDYNSINYNCYRDPVSTYVQNLNSALSHHDPHHDLFMKRAQQV